MAKIKLDGFLKVPDIPGPSERDGHEEEIEVHGVEFEMVSPWDASSFARRGQVELHEITFTKYYDMSSPYLKTAVFDNVGFKEVVFSARRTIEGETSDYLVVTLTNAIVVNYEMSQSEDEDDLIEEEISFGFKQIKFVYDDDYEAEFNVRTAK